ncbi:hypothetical protein NE237_032656 [Protea cynaroides]|uniref:C2 domain-containing protein n=1 Tax=Protea cynaroides TaxID=273540 RepID=A0A9Q0L4N0_9MAGN|nr:hypothetical protein NE237_032656 [Protea cynaroides]
MVKKNLNPYWGEEFCFQVEGFNEELLLCVLDEDKFFNDFVGQLKVPFADKKSLGTAWYSLQPKNKKSKNKGCGEILLTISLCQSNSCLHQTFPCNHIESEMPKPANHEDKVEGQTTYSSFEEAMRIMMERDHGGEIPSNLSGGILLDQSFVIAPADLNSLLFSPDSNFTNSLAKLQGTKELQIGPWRTENGSDNLKRVVTYIKAASKLVKALKAIEEQMYLKADGKVFAVSLSVSTPDVIFGNTFKTELLFCITPGPDIQSGEQTSWLVISWRMNFLQSTMMKNVIECGARQGLKDGYEQFMDLLSQNVKAIER